MQTQLMSLIEALMNTIVGFLISFVITSIVFKCFNLKSSTRKNLLITLIFTIASIVRSYVLRRFFNGVEF